MLEQTVLLAQDELITPNQLTICHGLFQDSELHVDEHSYTSPAPERSITRISDMERDLVYQTLDKTDWNVSKSAKLLGLSRDMMRYRIEKYGLQRQEGAAGYTVGG